MPAPVLVAPGITITQSASCAKGEVASLVKAIISKPNFLATCVSVIIPLVVPDPEIATHVSPFESTG